MSSETSETGASDSSIMSIAELIDSAFGLPQENTVNHKLIQVVLFILANQLRVLERQVEVVGSALTPSSSTLSITEVKIKAKKKGMVSAISAVDVSGIKGKPPKLSEGGRLGGRIRSLRKKVTPDTVIEEEESKEIEVIHKAKEKGKGEDEKGKERKLEKIKSGDDSSSSFETSSTKLYTGSTTEIRPDKKRTKQPDKVDESVFTSSDTTFTGKTKFEKSLPDKPAADKSSLEKKVKPKFSSDRSYSEESFSDKAVTAKIDKVSSKQISDKTSIVSSKPISDITGNDKHAVDKRSKHRTLSVDETLSATFDASLKESDGDKTSSKGDKSSFKTTSDITDASLHLTSSAEKTLKKPFSIEKASGQPISSSSKPGAGKTSLDKSASQQVPSAEKTFSAEKISKTASSDKAVVDKMTKITLKEAISSSSEPGARKTSLDKSANQQVPSAEKTFSAKKNSKTASSDKTMVDKATDITLKEATSEDKSIMPPSSISERSSYDETSSAKTSTRHTKSSDTSSDKTSSETKKYISSSSERSTSKSDLDKTAASKRAKSTSTKKTTDTKGKKGRLDLQLLEALEEKRERLLRIIHQRTDSWEEQNESPTPMASLDSMEAEYEKLLVVERVSSKEAREREMAARKGRSGIPKLSIVTQEEFNALAQTVRQIQHKYQEIGRLELPENVKLMHELRKGASLTDAMGALQLSARLEAAEKTLQNMMNIVGKLASKTDDSDAKPISPASRKVTSKMLAKNKKGVDKTSSEESLKIVIRKTMSLDRVSGVTSTPTPTATDTATMATAEPVKGVTYIDLDDALQKLRDQIMETVEDDKVKTNICSERILKHVKMMEGKLNASLQLDTKMDDLENLVAKYAEKINALDTGLSAQMTSYQEELTQIQHDLETGLDNMAEVLANTTTDTTAISDLNTNFTILQADIDNTMLLQKDLQETQEEYEIDLSNLRKQIETLQGDKSDRDEVADALRDKAGLGELNGLVSLEQFDAVRGDFEKRIIMAYDKFNNKETYWQKTIDDLLRDLNEKVDIALVKSFEQEVSKNVNNLTAKLNSMLEIVGEPSASVVSKRLHRDEACLSCATPAHLESKAPQVPALPGLRPPTIGAEAPRPGGQGDYDLCYPGKPIPHPIDPRAHICKRWCGGSHTAIPTGLTKAPAGITLSPIIRDTTTTVGTDGKVYQTDGPLKKPCKPCFIPPPSEAEPELADEAEATEPQLPSTQTDECPCFPVCERLLR